MMEKGVGELGVNGEVEGEWGIEEVGGKGRLVYYVRDEGEEGKKGFVEKGKGKSKEYGKLG